MVSARSPGRRITRDTALHSAGKPHPHAESLGLWKGVRHTTPRPLLPGSSRNWATHPLEVNAPTARPGRLRFRAAFCRVARHARRREVSPSDAVRLGGGGLWPAGTRRNPKSLRVSASLQARPYTSRFPSGGQSTRDKGGRERGKEYDRCVPGPDADLYATAYSAIRGMLQGPSVQGLRAIAGAAGFDITRFTNLDARSPIFGEMDRQFRSWPTDRQAVGLGLLAERLVRSDGAALATLQSVLNPLGIDYVGGNFVPIGLFDAREAVFVASDSVDDLSKASSRLADGDYTGAISAACGAVDAVTQRLYDKHGMGPPPTSFQTKVNTVALRLGVWDHLRREYEASGVGASDAAELVEHMRAATNSASQGLQVLRRTQGDVHGSKSATIRTAYQVIKWASAICALLAECDSAPRPGSATP